MKKIFYFCFFVCLILLSGVAAAQVQLETGLPNIPNNQLEAGKELPSYINYLFIFGLGAIAILALARMMTGGIKYILAAGNVGEHEEAKKTIQQALLGLGLLLASYLLLKTINPDLVNLRNPNLTPASFTGQNWSPGQSAADWLKNQNDTDTALRSLSAMPNGTKVNVPLGFVEKIDENNYWLCNPDCTIGIFEKK